MASDVCELTLKDKGEVGVAELNDISSESILHTYLHHTSTKHYEVVKETTGEPQWQSKNHGLAENRME